jgi:hypothetical protein
MTLSGAEIKRQILMAANSSEIKKKVHENPPGISDGEYIEMGNDLEAITKMKGWILIESYMIRRMNLVGLALADKEQPDAKGIAKGYIELMQWIQIVIQKRDEILEQEKTRHATSGRKKEQAFAPQE